MHECFCNHDAMCFWDRPVHTKRIQSDRVVSSFIDCTPLHYQSSAVADIETDRCLGLVNYHDRHLNYNRATIGYRIYPAYQRRSLATEAVSAMLNYWFSTLRLHRIKAFINLETFASCRKVENLGVCPEGLLRDNLRVSEVWRSDMLYALLETDQPSPA